MKLDNLIVRGIFPAVLSILLVSAGLVVSASGSGPSMETVRAEAERGGYRLIATDELAELYVNGDKDLLIVDTRQGWEYRAGHIAGAVNFPMEPTWWERLKSRRALRKALGPDREKLLVFY
jgi:3-mercaptopyruvate sulfurtransferase SseA